MTAGGKVVLPPLDGHGAADNSFDPKRLRGALEQFRKLPAQEQKPRLEDLPAEQQKAGYPPPPAAGVVLKMHGRAFGLDGDSVHPYPHFGGSPMLDYLWLTKEEAKMLLPETPRKGESVALPPWFARRLTWSRMVTEPLEGSGLPAHRRERGAHSLVLTVEEASEKEMGLRLHGAVPMRFVGWDIQNRRFAEGDYDCDYQFLGYLTYEFSNAAFTRFDLVALGAVNQRGAFKYPQPERGRLMSGLTFELGNGTLAERIPPYGMTKEYFSHSD